MCLSPLPSSEIQELVDRRQGLRSRREFSAADEIKRLLEGAGVKLQDKPGGGTVWARSTALRENRPNPMLAYAREARRLAGWEGREERGGSTGTGDEEMSRVLQRALEAWNQPEGSRPLMLGRTAADAAFSFALAGVRDGKLIDALAHQQADEFGRWSGAQPLTTLQTCEKLAAAGVRASHPVFRQGAATLRSFAEGLEGEERRKLIQAADRAEDVALEAGAKDAQAPLVVDLGCGFGSSLLSLIDAEDGRGDGTCTRGAINLLGCDASPLKVAFARGVAARWQVAGRAQFACASALATLAEIRESYPGGTAVVACGILLQFPSPYRAPSANSGNLQLPTAVDDDAYMVTTTLVQAVHQTLSPTGWFIIQSNVEDVAVHARGIAEAEGFYALPDPHDEQCDRSSPIRGDTSLLKSEQPRKTSYGQKRRERIVDAFGADFPRAVGLGWWDDNPLGNVAASETEAMLEEVG
ncbi:MAG: hypothetical protein SGPRY_005705 [Prymnesium sp.]